MTKRTNLLPSLDGDLRNILMMELEFICIAVPPFPRTLYDRQDTDFDSQWP
jgi:hypothetical protein